MQFTFTKQEISAVVGDLLADFQARYPDTGFAFDSIEKWPSGYRANWSLEGLRWTGTDGVAQFKFALAELQAAHPRMK